MRKKRSDRAKALRREAARIRERVEKTRKEMALAEELKALVPPLGPRGKKEPMSKSVKDGFDALIAFTEKELARSAKSRKHGRGGRVDVVYEEDNVPLNQDERW